MDHAALRTHFGDLYLEAVWDAEWDEMHGRFGAWRVALNGHDLPPLNEPIPTFNNADACQSALAAYVRDCWNRLPDVWYVRSLHEKVGDWLIDVDPVETADGDRVWRVRINGSAGMLTPILATGTQPAREVRDAVHAWLQRTWGIPDA